MRENRFFLQFDPNKKDLILNDKDLFNQVKNVLRMRSGDEIVLCDGNKNECIFAIDDFGKNEVMGKVVERRKNQNESETYGVLYCAVLKKENFELVVQKAVEIGISEIVPVITERTVKTNLNMERLHKVIKEASEQSGRGVLAKICEPMKFDDATDMAKSNGLNLFFDISVIPARLAVANESSSVQRGGVSPKYKIPNVGDEAGIQSKNIDSRFRGNDRLLVGAFVGPEGGWTEDEREIAKKAGFKFVNLGKTVLRGETAAILASYKILN